jgi:hypothetical protein
VKGIDLQSVLQYTQHKNHGNYGAYFQLDDGTDYNETTKILTRVAGEPLVPDRDYR